MDERPNTSTHRVRLAVSEGNILSNVNSNFNSHTYTFANFNQENNSLFNKLPPISNRPLTSFSYSEWRDCISDLMAAGSLRAFDAKHKHRRESLERTLERQWKEQERINTWRTAHMRNQISTRRPDKDKGVLETVVKVRNQQRKEYLSKGISSDMISNYMGRKPLPKETRAIQQRKYKPVFFWGC